MDKKIKVAMLSDSIFAASGCGIESKYFAEALLKSGKFQIRQLSAAIKHQSYQPIVTEEFSNDLISFPVNGFANPEIIRSFIRTERPDIFYCMADPRLLVHFFEMSDEILPLMPIVYYNIWDELPEPSFNKSYYESCSKLVPISKLTEEINRKVAPTIPCERLGHTCDPSIFKILPEEEVKQFRQETFKNPQKPNLPADMNKFILFYNGRNARRKHTATMIWWFKDFLDQIGHNNATFLLHTDCKDSNGSDLEAILEELGLVNGEVLFSRDRIPPEALAKIYNMVDCTLQCSSNEGFGKSVLESLFCGTPVIGTKTGGIQEQIIGDDGTEYGVCIEPASKTVVGSQDVPFIFEANICKEDFLAALHKIYKMTRTERKALGRLGHEHATKNYNFEKHQAAWVRIMEEVYAQNGSWNTRKNYKPFVLKTIK